MTQIEMVKLESLIMEVLKEARGPLSHIMLVSFVQQLLYYPTADIKAVALDMLAKRKIYLTSDGELTAA